MRAYRHALPHALPLPYGSALLCYITLVYYLVYQCLYYLAYALLIMFYITYVI